MATTTTRIYTDAKEQTSRIVAPNILAGTQETQEDTVEKSRIIAEHLASNGGVSGSVKGGAQNGKRVETSIFIAECGKVFTTADSRTAVLKAKLHRKVCPICSANPVRGMKMTNVKANATGNHQMTLDISNSYYANNR
jgi:hypothetical protein